MRHVILTCRNHPNLRWSTKECAFTDEHGYNGSRNIFFDGETTGKMFEDGSGLKCEDTRERADGSWEIISECKCSPKDLIRAPEDSLVKQE
jgi:hypothetical protein